MGYEKSMRRPVAGLFSLGFLFVAGCQTEAPARVRVPDSNEPVAVRYYPQPKPIYVDPPQSEMPLPMDDPPLFTQAPPEQTQYLEAYQRVGRPRIVVFVNRSIEGNLISTVEPERIAGLNVNARARLPNDSKDRNFSASAEIYLPPGKYDEVQARSIDYEAIELVMGDLLAANGRVILISPNMARTRLTDEQIEQVQNGRPIALRVLAETLDTDVLIQVQARPTSQTRDGLGVRVLAEAIDVADGGSLARAFVDIPPPLTKITLQKYSRFLSRKLMYNLAGAWRYNPSDDVRGNTANKAEPTPQK